LTRETPGSGQDDRCGLSPPYGLDASSEQFTKPGGGMDIIVVCVVVIACAIFMISNKKRRGSFFWWRDRKGGPDA
jgi:hypothetical protein